MQTCSPPIAARLWAISYVFLSSAWSCVPWSSAVRRDMAGRNGRTHGHCTNLYEIYILQFLFLYTFDYNFVYCNYVVSIPKFGCQALHQIPKLKGRSKQNHDQWSRFGANWLQQPSRGGGWWRVTWQVASFRIRPTAGLKQLVLQRLGIQRTSVTRYQIHGFMCSPFYSRVPLILKSLRHFFGSACAVQFESFISTACGRCATGSGAAVWEVEDPQPLSMLTNLKIISNIFFFKRISHCDIPWHVKHIIWKYIIYLDIFRLADWPCWPAGSWTFTRCTELWQIGYAWLWCIAPCTDCVEHPFKANYQLGRRTDRKGERKAELID